MTLTGYSVVYRARRILAGALLTLSCSLACMQTAVSAQTTLLVEPKMLSSKNGLLDILMIAKPMRIKSIGFQPPKDGAIINPIGWVYEICPRSISVNNNCPVGAETIADYGGAHLALQPGDVLKIRLINRLPALNPLKVKRGVDPGQGNLFRNPTNLHTHGLIVAPRAATSKDPTFGDYVFIEAFNPANGMPEPQLGHQHGSIKMGFIDYRIEIPKNHPSGVFWFHPHVHGLSLNQVSAGLAGIITVGAAGDYVRSAPKKVRHLILKDLQVLATGKVTYGDDLKAPAVAVTNGEVQNQQISDFCEQPDNSGPTSRLGYCDGEPPEHGSVNGFVGSRWYFTINGQVFPTIRVTSSNGELWRLVNASAQVSYRLNLIDDVSQQPLFMQLVAIDGIAISVPAGTAASEVTAVGGNKFSSTPCPPKRDGINSMCIKDLVMMPGSRAEVWITYRDKQGNVISPPSNASATLKQVNVYLGPGAEAWPVVKLARVEFGQPRPTTNSVAVFREPSNLDASVSSLVEAPLVHTPPSLASPTDRCRALGSGHRRRIFFGTQNPSNARSPFGIGYEEVDASGKVVPGSVVQVSAFDPDRTLVCLPLGSHGAIVHETWELINLSNETHNFHIHQTRFSVIANTSVRGEKAQSPAMVVEDSVPVPFATSKSNVITNNQNGSCTISQWHSGQCVSKPVVVDIPFSQAGEFVFHCHILEHEDDGMMAKIRVVAGIL